MKFHGTYCYDCPKIRDLKPKCGKCGLPHRIEIVAFNVDIAQEWIILKIGVG
jgi:hypothetical protein